MFCCFKPNTLEYSFSRKYLCFYIVYLWFIDNEWKGTLATMGPSIGQSMILKKGLQNLLNFDLYD